MNDQLPSKLRSGPGFATSQCVVLECEYVGSWMMVVGIPFLPSLQLKCQFREKWEEANFFGYIRPDSTLV